MPTFIDAIRRLQTSLLSRHNRNRRYRNNIRCETLQQRQLMAADIGLSNHAVVSQTISSKSTSSLAAVFSSADVHEGSKGAVTLTLSRNTNDVAENLLVRVIGGDPSQLPIPTGIVIPAGDSSLSIRLTPVDDAISESAKSLDYSFVAAGHRATSASIMLVDDDTPEFQNPTSRFDVNGDGRMSPQDALIIINALAESRGSTIGPEASHQPGEPFVDVNGDNKMTPADALDVINQLAESRARSALTSVSSRLDTETVDRIIESSFAGDSQSPQLF